MSKAVISRPVLWLASCDDNALTLIHGQRAGPQRGIRTTRRVAGWPQSQGMLAAEVTQVAWSDTFCGTIRRTKTQGSFGPCLGPNEPRTGGQGKRRDMQLGYVETSRKVKCTYPGIRPTRGLDLAASARFACALGGRDPYAVNGWTIRASALRAV